jgi:hypothetical protein
MTTAARETIMTALLGLLTSSIASGFTADAAQGSAVLSNVTPTNGLFLGMPADGPAGLFPASTFIASLAPLTLSEVATANATAAAFTTGFRTTGRRLQMWNQVAEQPALFLRNIADEYPKRHGRELPPATIVEAEAWVYSNAGKDPDLAPAVGLNNLIDAIKAVLDPVPGLPQTLGLATSGPNGTTVQHCWIEGRIDMHPGDLDGQAIAVIPIKILAPGL